MSGAAVSADGASKTPSNMTVIDVNQLSIQELGNFQEQLDNELEFFVESLQQLKEIQGKFASSGESLSSVGAENKGKEILIPLTSSMYVPGSLSSVNTVLIDIGTGYYVEMSVDKAKEYFQRKTQEMSKQIERLQGLVQEKQRVKSVMTEVLQTKVQQALSAAQQMHQQQAVPPVKQGSPS